MSKSQRSAANLFVNDGTRQIGWHQFAGINRYIRSTRRWRRTEELNKQPKTCKCCYVRIASENLSCDPCHRFCRRRLVLLPFYFRRLTCRERSTYIRWLENQRLLAYTSVPFFIFNWSRCESVTAYLYTVKQVTLFTIAEVSWLWNLHIIRSNWR